MNFNLRSIHANHLSRLVFKRTAILTRPILRIDISCSLMLRKYIFGHPYITTSQSTFLIKTSQEQQVFLWEKIITFWDTTSLGENTAVITYSLTCVTLLSSTHHWMLHCLLLIILLAVYLSYGFNKKYSFFRVYLYRLYHSKVELIHPYSDLNNLKCSTFFLPSCQTYFMNYGLTSHIISTNSSSSFNNTNLSSVMSAFS